MIINMWYRTSGVTANDKQLLSEARRQNENVALICIFHSFLSNTQRGNMNRRAMFLCIWHKGISMFCFWILFILAVLGLRCCAGFLLAARGGCSLAVGCGLLTAAASFIVAHRLSCLWHVGHSWTRDWTHAPCISRQTLNHWTTREVSFQGF